MEVFILKEKLKNGLQVVEKLLSKSLSLPILNNVLIQAQKNFLILTTTDLESGIKWWGLAKVKKEGEITIPLSLFSNFLNFLPNQQIALQTKEDLLLIECGNYKVQIKGLSSTDFPIFPEFTKENFAEINSLSICQGLSQIVDIAASSQIRPEISGILFLLQKDSIKLVATDSFRLGEKTISQNNIILTNSFDKELSFIVPQKAVKEIINIFSQKENRVKIYFSQNQVLFESKMSEIDHQEIQFVSRLIEGEYPAYQEIIPKKYETQVILPKNEFLNHLKGAALFGGRINEIKLKIIPQKSRIDFFSQNPDIGEHHSFLVGKIKGNSLEVFFNHRFLVSGLQSIKSAEVIFEVQNKESPAVLKPVGDSSYIYVVMPIKTS
jgi:DNA polymerase-3 subunit beta